MHTFFWFPTLFVCFLYIPIKFTWVLIGLQQEQCVLTLAEVSTTSDSHILQKKYHP